MKKLSGNLLGLTLLALLTLTNAALEQKDFVWRDTLPILGDEYHTSCTLHSGYNLTMIRCADQFEVYDT